MEPLLHRGFVEPEQKLLTTAYWFVFEAIRLPPRELGGITRQTHVRRGTLAAAALRGPSCWHRFGAIKTCDQNLRSGSKVVTRTAISSEQAPDALGPYSQAIVAGGLVFCSGMAGIDPETGAAAEGIEAQTEQALLNLAAVLNAAGSSMNDVVKTTIFYADVDDFSRLNEVYARHMPDPPPARSAPAHVRLPRGLLVSIEAIAVLPGTST